MIETLNGSYRDTKPARTLGYFALVAGVYALIFAGVALASVFAQPAALVASKPVTVISITQPLQISPQRPVHPQGMGGGTPGGNPQESNPGAESKRDQPAPEQIALIPFLPPGPSNSHHLPLPLGGGNWIPGVPNGPGGFGVGNGGAGLPAPPPPPRVETTQHEPLLLKSEIILGKATRQVRPEYPELVRRIRVQGSVQVEITVDEGGHVITARAVSGPPLLFNVSVEAARQWLFAPTLLNGHTVLVRGLITFNFVLN